MSANKEREFLLGLYPGKKGWKQQVKKMSDAQVIAIYLRKKGEPKKPKESKPDEFPF